MAYEEPFDNTGYDLFLLCNPLGVLVNVTLLNISFFQISGNPVEVHDVHYINPQFQVTKRFEIDNELHEMYDSIRLPFTCVLRKYFMMRNLPIQELILRLERIDCTYSTLSQYAIVSDLNLKALNYFSNEEKIQKINDWLGNMQITYRMVDEAVDVFLSTASVVNEETKCQNSTVHELFVHRLRQKFLQPLHYSFAKNSRICAMLENGKYNHSLTKQSARCLMNNITATQRSSEVGVDMTCSDRNLEQPYAFSSGPESGLEARLILACVLSVLYF